MDKQLIATIFRREPIWNPASELHRNAVVLKKLWEQVADELQKDVKTVKARWKNLRAYFFKIHGKETEEAKMWQHYDQLSFLMGEDLGREINLSINNDDHYSVLTETSEEQQNQSGSDSSQNHDLSYSRAPKRKKIRKNRPDNNVQYLEIQNELLERATTTTNKEKNDDLLFFESLLPYMKNIPLLRKLKLRSKIQDLILAEIEEANNDIKSVPVPSYTITYPAQGQE